MNTIFFVMAFTILNGQQYRMAVETYDDPLTCQENMLIDTMEWQKLNPDHEVHYIFCLDAQEAFLKGEDT